ncbi:MAG: anhydro-N-acetylmuramic acid kinase [Planctomycetota bacterium]
MTGTSIDGLDATLIEAEGEALSLQCRVIESRSASYPDLGDRLQAVANSDPVTAQDLAAMALELGRLHASLASELVSPDLAVCVIPGQTLFHRPPQSLQLVNPWPVAHALSCPVLFDLRSSDIAAGGQGAPITPLADWILFRDPQIPRVVINLGGFCNATLLPPGATPDTVRGLDVCVCNQLLDRCARLAINADFDKDGAMAERGTLNAEAASELRPILDRQTKSGLSLGSGDEASAWAVRHASELRPADLLATAAHTVGTHIGQVTTSMLPDAECLLAGGGTHNRALVQAMCAHAKATTTQAHGVGISERESACMAVLGLLALDGVPPTLAQVTGRADEVRNEGCWIGRAP